MKVEVSPRDFAFALLLTLCEVFSFLAVGLLTGFYRKNRLRQHFLLIELSNEDLMEFWALLLQCFPAKML